MFIIEISIESIKELTGLAALDARRRLGLPDGVYLSCDDDTSPLSRDVEVSESFARLHFPPTAIRMRADVRFAALMPGDVTPYTKGNEKKEIAFAPEETLSDARIIDLFLGTPAEFRTVE